MAYVNAIPADDQLIQVLRLSKTPTAIHYGEDAKVVFANDAMLAVWGKGSEVIGLSLEDALPELKGQPFIEMFAKVWREGIIISGTDTAAELIVDGKSQIFYFDFEYRAVKDHANNVIAILHSAVDVTARFLAQEDKKLAQERQQLLEREQALNEELAASNEEVMSVNEELESSREQLLQMNADLERRVAERVKAFTESEERFRTMAENTDVLIAVSNENGQNTYFNKAWSKLSGKTNNQLLANGWHDLLYYEDRQRFVKRH